MAHHQFESSCAGHCQMAVTVGFSLRQFSEVFKIRDADGQPYVLIGDLKSAIEIVRRIPGISDLHTPAIQAEWEDQTIRVLDPISLLACKLELAATVSQEKRRDVAHLKILLPCVRAFLSELLQQVE